MSAGLPPLGFGPDVENAEQQAELEAYMRSVYPQGVPQGPPPLESQPVRFGRFNIPGAGFDAASVAILQQLQNARRPRNFGEGLVQGALGSLAGGRARGMNQRQAEYERKQKEADTAVSTRAGMARSLAQWRYDPNRIARSSQMFRLTKKEAEAMGEGYDTTTPVSGSVKSEAMQRTRPVDSSVALSRDLLNEGRRSRLSEARAGDAEDESLLEDYAEKVATFRIKPDEIPKRDPRWNAALQVRIDNKLMAKGAPHSLQQLDQLWNSTKKWLNTSNAQRAVNTRKAAMTVLDHIAQFTELTDKYREAYEKLPGLKKMELRVGNRGVYLAALNGALGPEAAANAAGLETVVNVLPTEYATVLSGGFAPQKEQLDESRRVFSAVLGPQGHKGRTEAVRRLVKARVRNEQRNFNMIGGDKNPYLMDISKLEGWDLDRPLDSNPEKDKRDESRRLEDKYR